MYKNVWEKKSSKVHKLVTKKSGEQSFFCATRRSDLIHIPLKLQEDIPNTY